MQCTSFPDPASSCQSDSKIANSLPCSWRPRRVASRPLLLSPGSAQPRKAHEADIPATRWVYELKGTCGFWQEVFANPGRPVVLYRAGQQMNGAQGGRHHPCEFSSKLSIQQMPSSTGVFQARTTSLPCAGVSPPLATAFHIKSNFKTWSRSQHGSCSNCCAGCCGMLGCLQAAMPAQ